MYIFYKNDNNSNDKGIDQWVEFVSRKSNLKLALMYS